jgi:hypothetical protein
VAGDDWYLLKKEGKLQLIPSSNEENTDSTIYIFRKREDLSYCIQDGFFGIDVTYCLNDLLFKGKYVNIDTKQEVIFAENGKLIGIEGFDIYEVRDYFGTLHMYYNLDVIYFINENYEIEHYNWVFSEDELLLTEFIHEKIADEDGNLYDSDFFILGEKKIRLKKIEKNR